MISYQQTQKEIIEKLSTDQEHGLSSDEAKKRLTTYGLNKLEEEKKRPLWLRFIAQFKDVMILILVGAAILSFIVSLSEGESLFEPILIVVIILINSIIGLIQEGKAERALEALKDMTPPEARVIREDETIEIPAAELVPGDIIYLEAGDSVPADARLIEANLLKVDESMLTGESEPVNKDEEATYEKTTAIGDRLNMLFSGSNIRYGSATAVVTETGMKTEIGTIASLLHTSSRTLTPLQERLSKLGVYIAYLAAIACVIVFVISITSGTDIMHALMLAIALAVSAIPEGLPAIVAVILAIGVQRMVKRNAIIRKLPAVETLGSASVICTDKTGTLTQNQMTLTHLYTAKNNQTVPIDRDLTRDDQLLLKLGTLCSNATITITDGEIKHIGDPTETAIVYAAHKAGIDQDELEEEYPRIEEFSFDSIRKRMSTVHEYNGETYVIVKGAYDSILPLCYDHTLQDSAEALEAMSQDALRVLAIAYKKLPSKPNNLTVESAESDLTFLGLVGMIDPPREEAKQAVKDCLTAGITPIMITGDHVTTATAIAKEVYILNKPEHEAITGEELDEMSDAELYDRIQNIRVYARTSPENKIRIVKQWQSLGHVVAMTGDGVNDAPALKAADIGCAMGITGTDVAKGASHMVLTDDNFATIVAAIREGRGIYANIRKVVGLLLGTNMGEVVAVLATMIVWQQSPLLAVHLLFINLVTDSMPAIALGMEPVEDEVMSEKPKPKNEGLFANGFGVQIVFMGLFFGLITFIAYWIGWKIVGSHEAGQTMAFGTLALSQVLHSFSLRSRKSLLQINPFSNPLHLWAIMGSILTVLLVLFIPPATEIFSLTNLPSYGYTIIFLLSISPIFVMEIYKGLITNRPSKA